MKKMTCIICPVGCSLVIENPDDYMEVSGAKCKRGELYAVQELTNPLRTVQSTIRSTIPGYRRAAVKTSGPVPLKDVFVFMDEINKIVLNERKMCGDVLVHSLNESDVDLILTERLY